MRFKINILILQVLVISILFVSAYKRKALTKKFKEPNYSERSLTRFSQYCNKFSYINQNIDHFNFNPSNDQKYKQRYIYFDNYANEGSPIFFYTGNEGDIKWFCENTGFMWEIAPKFNAVVVFAEHRYYGTSLPFGNESFVLPNINYLTSEQALADYAYLIKFLKSNNTKLKNSPVIAFGGSYGGMLAAWFRMKYPNMVVGAIAASAPIWQFNADCDSFQSVVTSAFKKSDSECPGAIRSSWDAINLFSKTEKGLNELQSIFKLCEPLTNVKNLKDWLADIYGNIAMANYPYDTNFLAPLPAWPVKVMCNNITKNLDKKDPANLLNSIYNGINVFLNYTGDSKCFDLGSDTPFDINMISWTYQTCTEFVFPFCTNGVNDMFEKEEWDPIAYNKDCYDQFKTLPRDEWPIINYGGNAQDIKYHSNIVFSNGDLDPWSSGGVLKNVNDKLVAVLIENGAHHLDLRESNANDPDSVIFARLKEIDAIDTWIRESMKN